MIRSREVTNPGFFKRKITVKEREREINKTEREKDVHFDTVALCLRDREIERERFQSKRKMITVRKKKRNTDETIYVDFDTVSSMLEIETER